MNNTPLVSIIVPFFNRESYLPRTLNSLLKIQYRPLEIIFIDNNSSDDSVHVVYSYLQLFLDRNIQVNLLNEKKQGVCCARNKGLHIAKGEFIYFFDSDDEISSDFLSHFFLENIDNDLIIIPIRIIKSTGKITKKHIEKKCTNFRHIISSLLSTQTMLIRRKFLLSIGGWNENLDIWNDWELGVRVLNSNPKFILFPKEYHLIYEHVDSITGDSLGKSFYRWYKAIKSVKNLNLGEKEKLAINIKCIILYGWLKKHNYNKEAKMLFREIKMSSLKCYILYYYSLFIGKGSWFIAYILF